MRRNRRSRPTRLRVALAACAFGCASACALGPAGVFAAQDPAAPAGPGLPLPAPPEPSPEADLPPLPIAPEALADEPRPLVAPHVVAPEGVFAGPAAQPRGPLEIGDLVEVAGEPEAEVNVIVGRSRIFTLKRPASRIVLANPAIANVRFLDPEDPSPHLLDLYGVSFGSTTLTLWDEQERATTIRLRVTIDVRDLESRIAAVFPGAEVRVTQLASQVILDGQVPDAKTMSEVLQVVRATLIGQATSVTNTGGGGLGAGGAGGGNVPAPPVGGVNRTSFQEEPVPATPIQTPAPVPVPVPPVAPGTETDLAVPSLPIGPGQEYIPGTEPVPDVPLLPSASPYVAAPRSGGGSLAPGTIVNRVRVPGPRQILLKVKIAEINRTALRQLGVNWQRITDGDVINQVVGNIGAAGSQLFGIFDEGNFSIFINALRVNSLAKILAEPNLVALDGQPARFLAGGRFPYPVPQSATIPGGGTVVTIQFQDFGAILQFIPHILDRDTIRLDVEPVFSELNFATGTSVAGTTVPGINQRSARTVVQLREGQTLAIAGLLSTRTNGATTRIPGLGDAPIVGQLFSRNSIETVETELVVLVTPVLVDPLDANEVPPQPGDRVWEPNDWEFFFLGRLEGRTGHPFRATVHYLDPLDVMKHFRSENHWVIGPHGHAD